MRMKQIMSGALVAAGIAIATPVMAAAPAAAVACSLEGQNHLFGRTVNLWNCGGSYHGQIQGAQAGDSVEMREVFLLATVPFGRMYVQPGSTTANSLSKRLVGWPIKACLNIGDMPGREACT